MLQSWIAIGEAWGHQELLPLCGLEVLIGLIPLGMGVPLQASGQQEGLLEERHRYGWRLVYHCKSSSPSSGRGTEDLMVSLILYWRMSMQGNRMLNTQCERLADPENHPFAFRASSAISIIFSWGEDFAVERKVVEWSVYKAKNNCIYGLGVWDLFGSDHLYLSALHTGGKLLDSLKCWAFYNNNNNNLKIFPAVKGCSFSFISHYVCKTNW